MAVSQLVLDMGFPDRVVRFRKQQGWTQQELADRVGVRVLQIRRYESGASQPTLEVIKNMAVALGVTTDELIFDTSERDPSDDLRLRFERVSRFSEDEKRVVKELLDGMILKHEAGQVAALKEQ